MDLKTFQLLTLEWLDQRFPNFFEPYLNLSLVKSLTQRPKPQTYYKKIMIVSVILAVSC